MPYQLVLSESRNEITRDVGENVFFANLPSDYEVYIFYYPGAMPNVELETRLRNFGNNAGKNLFVNIGRLNDPNYRTIANKFNIRSLPVIIVTAIDKLASSPVESVTAYVKIDDKKLLNSPDSSINCLQELFLLFLQGKISEAMGQLDKARRNLLITNALKGIWDLLGKTDITISFIEGKFEIKHSGG